MKLSEVKAIASQVAEIKFQLPNGSLIPNHFHITEVGIATKNFIDCGGKVREEKNVNFQLWEADDFDHRLAPQKLISIIELSERVLSIPDLEVEVEYQSETIGKYEIGFDGNCFQLIAKQTNCLAMDKCGIPTEKLKINITDLGKSIQNTCTPGGKCC